MSVVSKQNSEHYTWGQACDGWHLVQAEGLSVIHEKMPPGTQETRHFHERARQFFFILSGTAVMEADGERHTLLSQQGIEIAPSIPHQIRNESDKPVEFLVVSQPSSRGDRKEN